MRGKIVELNIDGIKNKHGFIKGNNDIKYYFNQDCIADETHIDEFHIGDLADFSPKPSSSNFDIASSLRKETNFRTKVTSRFYAPGISQRLHPNDFDKYLKPNCGEKAIIEKIGKVLSISKLGYHCIDKYSVCQFCLAGTTEIFKKFTRENGEFIIIFSHFSNELWQQKTLLVEREMRKRRDIIDRHPFSNFYFLISNSKDLFEKIDAIKGKAHSAIIPFSFEELLNCESNTRSISKLILDRLGKYYFENNMLGDNDAIDDDNLLFGDRNKIADLIVSRCYQGKNSGIFGLRRSGKTSVLKAVLRRLDWDEVPYVFVQSRTFETFDSWKNVLFEIACLVRAKMLKTERSEDETWDQFHKRLNLSSSKEDYENRGVAAFIDDVKRYCPEDKRLIIAFDEIELITYNTATSPMWKSLNSYKGFWSALRDCGCPLVVCGVNSTINESSNLSYQGEECDNPIYGRIVTCAESVQTYLPTFTDEQTKIMINTLGRYSNIAFSNVYGQINRAFGGQPWAIRQFCSYAYENVKSQRVDFQVYQISRATCDNLMRKFQYSSEGIRLCETIIQHLSIYNEEYSLLIKLAFNPEKYGSISTDDSINIDHLKKYGLIHYDDTTKYASFCIGIIKDYICKNANKSPEDMNNMERRRFVQDRVAVCERRLKGFVRNYYTYVLTATQGLAMFNSYFAHNRNFIKPHRGIDVHACNFNDFFDHRKFDFYFSKLQTIIADHWDTLGQKIELAGVNKEKFISSMQDLNAGRTDADHYDPENSSDCPTEWEIDNKTMRAFQSAYDTLDAFFKTI